MSCGWSRSSRCAWCVRSSEGRCWRPSVSSRVRLMTGGACRRAGAGQDPALPSRGAAAPVTIAAEDLRAQVVRVEERVGGDTSGLTSARVVVGGRPRRRWTGGVRRGHRPRRTPGRRPRSLPRRHLTRLAPAPRTGRPDRIADLAGPLHSVRHLRGHPALGGVRVEQDHPRDQHRPRRADDDQGRLRRRRRHARGGPGDPRGARLTAEAAWSTPRPHGRRRSPRRPPSARRSPRAAARRSARAARSPTPRASDRADRRSGSEPDDEEGGQ